MDRAGRDNYLRFPVQKNADGKYLCRVCKCTLEGRKQSFCSPRCLRDFFMQTDWNRVRGVVYVRDGGVCMICGKRVAENDYHVDHIIPISKGGDEWNLDNLQLTCPRCNLSKSDKLDDPEQQEILL